MFRQREWSVQLMTVAPPAQLSDGHFDVRVRLPLHTIRRLDALQDSVATSVSANGRPVAPAAAPSLPAAAPAQAAGGVSGRTWQTLREALAHAAEGRILSAAALLAPAAAASGLSESALLARLRALTPAAPGLAGDANGSAAQQTTAVEQADTRASQAGQAAPTATIKTAAVAWEVGHSAGPDRGQLSAKEAARVLALPEEAAWLREGLRQFHDREGYVMARDDDLRVSYRHLKGACEALPHTATTTSERTAPVPLAGTLLRLGEMPSRAAAAQSTCLPLLAVAACDVSASQDKLPDDTVQHLPWYCSAKLTSWAPPPPGSTVHSFRFEAVYTCGVSHLLSISREFDLMASWNRFVLNPCVLCEPEPTPFSSLLVSGSQLETAEQSTLEKHTYHARAL